MYLYCVQYTLLQVCWECQREAKLEYSECTCSLLYYRFWHKLTNGDKKHFKNVNFYIFLSCVPLFKSLKEAILWPHFSVAKKKVLFFKLCY